MAKTSSQISRYDLMTLSCAPTPAPTELVRYWVRDHVKHIDQKGQVAPEGQHAGSLHHFQVPALPLRVRLYQPCQEFTPSLYNRASCAQVGKEGVISSLLLERSIHKLD